MDKLRGVVAGGENRQESCYLGLVALAAAPDDIVLIHDAVRPLVSEETILRCARAAGRLGAANTVVPSTDTLLFSEDGVTMGLSLIHI